MFSERSGRKAQPENSSGQFQSLTVAVPVLNLAPVRNIAGWTMPETPTLISRHGPLPSKDADSRHTSLLQTITLLSNSPPSAHRLLISLCTIPSNSLFSYTTSSSFYHHPLPEESLFLSIYLMFVFTHQIAVFYVCTRLQPAPNVSKSLIE